MDLLISNRPYSYSNRANPLIGVKITNMGEKHDLLAAILAAKEQGIGQSLRLQWRTFAADIMAVRLQKQ